MSTRGAMIKLQYIPITCLRGPHFLVVWSIHILCNLLCTTCGIATRGIAMHGGHRHTVNMHYLNEV